MMGWVIFRIEDMVTMELFFQKLFVFDGSTVQFIPGFKSIVVIATIFAFIALTKFDQNLIGFFFERNSYGIKTNFALAAIAVLLFVLSLSSITTSGFNPFIYFRF